MTDRVTGRVTGEVLAQTFLDLLQQLVTLLQLVQQAAVWAERDDLRGDRGGDRVTDRVTGEILAQALLNLLQPAVGAHSEITCGVTGGLTGVMSKFYNLDDRQLTCGFSLAFFMILRHMRSIVWYRLLSTGSWRVMSSELKIGSR